VFKSSLKIHHENTPKKKVVGQMLSESLFSSTEKAGKVEQGKKI